jgi:hypothetical protein
VRWGEKFALELKGSESVTCQKEEYGDHHLYEEKKGRRKEAVIKRWMSNEYKRYENLLNIGPLMQFVWPPVAMETPRSAVRIMVGWGSSSARLRSYRSHKRATTWTCYHGYAMTVHY